MSPTLTPEQARRYYDRNAHRQDAQGWYEDATLERLVALGDFAAASEVLELGCGTGRLAQRLLRDCLPRDARYTGIDISPAMLARAGTRLKKYAPRATLSPGDVTLGLAARSGSKDRIVASYLFDLLSPGHSRHLIGEIHRALRPGGLVCLAGLTRETQTGDTTIFTQIRALIQRLWPWLAGGCRPVDMRALLDGAQWRIVAHETVSPRGLASDILIARKL